MAEPGRRSAALLLATLLAVLGGACSDDDAPSGADGQEQPRDDGEGPDETDTGDGGETGGETGGGAADEPEAEPAELPASDQPFADALAGAMGVEQYTPEQASCIATRTVAVLGSERLAASGLTPEQLAEAGLTGIDVDRETAEDLYDVMADCGSDYRDVFLDQMVAGLDDPDAVRRCVEEIFTAEVVRDLVVDGILAGPVAEGDDRVAVDPELTAAAEACAEDGG